jgi:predicted CXXCH cytochrome family protein
LQALAAEQIALPSLDWNRHVAAGERLRARRHCAQPCIEMYAAARAGASRLRCSAQNGAPIAIADGKADGYGGPAGEVAPPGVAPALAHAPVADPTLHNHPGVIMRNATALLLPLAAVLVLGACDERIVFRDRDLLGGLPAGSQGFVGYSNVAQKMTVCGNCHVTQHNQWATTAHATAFVASGAGATTQAVCVECHGTTQRGNDVTQSAGLAAVNDVRFHDVQCEACHGPGEAHVRNPDGGTAALMLARVAAGIDMNGTCGECHNGFHHPYVAEWQASGHGSVIASPAGNPSCNGCHEGKAALRAMGVLSAYEEMGQTGHLAITCAVCHDPHRNRFDGQLRFSINVPDEQQNLCMRCHHKRGGPDFTAQNRGPHSPEGPMLLGEAGWWPPNMPVQPGSQIVGTHGSEANPRMCAGCHMQPVEVTGQAGQVAVSTTSHMFEAIPCLDAQGNPHTGNCAFTERTFRTCTASGCHGSQGAARSALLVVRQRIDNWNNQLKSQLARVPAAEFNPNDNRYSTAEGARFNSQLGDRFGSAAHNPFLMEALLIGSIEQVRRDYGINPSATLSELDAAMQDVMRRLRSKMTAAE